MKIQIGDYEVDSVILDLISDVKILTKQTWQLMGKLTLGWSSVQLRLENQAKVHPIGHISNLVFDVEGMKTYANFDVIEVVEDGVFYPTLLGIGWANDSMEVINFKRWVMTFENQDVRVIAPMDPQEGRWYIEPMRDEAGRSWDHAYNISQYYIRPTIDSELGWCSDSSASSNSDDALENWKNRLHEVSFRKCGLIT